MSLTQLCFSARQPGAGLRSSLKKVAVGQLPTWAARVCRQSGLRPERRRPGHGARFTAETARSVPSPSAPERALTFGDNLNRLTNLAATHVPTSTPITNFGYQYDAAGNRTQKSTLDYTEDYGYDPLYRLTRTDRTNPGATPPNQWTWNYDAVGNRTSAQKDSEATTSSYNEKNQLTGATGGGKMLWRGTLDEPGTASFSAATINGQPARMLAGNIFEATLDLPAGANNVTIQALDGSGNVATKVYSVNVIGVPSSHTYDANGNLTAKTEGADSWSYTWNALNQLTAVSKNAVSQATYSYDPRGRRVGRVAGATTTTWTYDGQDILRQTAGATTTTFVHGAGIDEPLAQTIGTTTEFLHADGLGSITRHTSSVGAVAQSIAYDAWGNIQFGTPSPFGFTGREWDSEAGLWYYRARHYDSVSGRFLSEDPAFAVADYSYVNGRPTVFVDSSGMTPEPKIRPVSNWNELVPACGGTGANADGCYRPFLRLDCTCVKEECTNRWAMVVKVTFEPVIYVVDHPEAQPVADTVAHERVHHDKWTKNMYNPGQQQAYETKRGRYLSEAACKANCAIVFAWYASKAAQNYADNKWYDWTHPKPPKGSK